jgi:uncharacterized membrane protein
METCSGSKGFLYEEFLPTYIPYCSKELSGDSLDFVSSFLEIVLFLYRAIFGLLLIFFIPGYVFTWAIYTRKEDLTFIVRIALSCVLSIAIAMLSTLFLDNVMGIDTTGLNITITLVILTLYLGFLYYFRVKWISMKK